MLVYQEDMTLNMRPEEIRDITNLLMGVVIRSDMDDGRLYASIIDSAGSVTTIKNDEETLADFRAALERMAPRDAGYAHDKANDDGNGRAHVLAALIGPDVSLPVNNGQLRLGKSQQVVVINHDVSPRARILVVSLVGSCRDLAHARHCKV